MDTLHNKRKGTIAEFQVIVELLSRNIVASVPQGEYSGYDIIADNQKGQLYRLQVKSTNQQTAKSTGFHFNIGRGQSQKTPYTLADCDFIVCVVYPAFYIIPISKIDVGSLSVYPNGNSGKAPANYSGRWEQYKNRWDLLD